MHPYDEGHIIGIGRDTKEIGNDRVQQLGIKIALFNVADVNNPKVTDEVIIGDSSTNSEALHNHKAFFFDKPREILSIPINGNSENLGGNSTLEKIVPEYNRWNGFYVFDIDVTNGINLKGAISHSINDSQHYGMSDARTFFIDEILYTVSDEFLKMNLLENLNEINLIKLENTGKFINYIEEDFFR